jgi:hypothetical protein
MRSFILYILFTLFSFNSANGQTRIILDRPGQHDSTIIPLVMVDNYKTDMLHLILDPKNIESIHVYKDSAAIAKFGESGKQGVVLIQPKANTVFLQLAGILDKYHIAKADRFFRVCINQKLMKEPGLILIEQSEFVHVEITEDIKREISETDNPNEKFINIITNPK